MSSYTKVKSYSDKQLINKVKSLPSYKSIPKGYWILGVRSKADTYDVYDDKFYIYKGEQFIAVLTGTTNTGGYGLKNFAKWDSRGVAHIKGNEWYYDVWSRGKHYGSSGSVDALRQTGAFKVIRDKDKNKKAGDSGTWTTETNRGLNFHPNTYNLSTTAKVLSWFIGSWSTGCQVINDIQGYKKFLQYTKPQNVFTYCLLEEF